ncbi:MAG: DUF4838 domain-containing protein [Victivallales bacterium]|nr:DUF4838 domain-containing protein [Victivallales bacterium]
MNIRRAIVSVVVGLVAYLRADGFSMVVNDRPAISVETKSYDPAVLLAKQELVQVLRSYCDTAGYEGEGSLLLRLAIAGDNSSEEADAAMTSNQLTHEELGQDGFLLHGLDKRRFILCAYSGKGVLNGVYKLLEKNLGVAFPRPAMRLDFAPHKALATPIVVPYWDKPCFSIRGFAITNSDWSHENREMNLWMARNLVNSPGGNPQSMEATAGTRLQYGFDMMAGGHTFYYWLPSRIYAERHPEYYSQVDGKPTRKYHRGAQIALGHPDVINIIAERMIAYKRKYPMTQILPFGYNDSDSEGFGFGDDPWSVQLDSAEDFPKPGSQRPRSYSTRYIKAANAIMEKVNSVYPELKMFVYAYHWPMLKAPDCEVGKNLLVSFAPLYRCCIHSMDDPNCPRNVLFAEFLRNWSEKTRNIFVRDYYDCRNYPRFPLETLKKDMQFYRSLGIAGTSPGIIPDVPNGANLHSGSQRMRGPNWQLPDRAYEETWDACALMFFVHARLNWSPDESIEDAVRLFCRNYYGDEAAENMARYHLEMSRRFYAGGHPGERNPRPLTSDFVNFGAFCLCWNWEPFYGKYAGKLISRNALLVQQKKEAQELLDIFAAAFRSARKLNDKRLYERMDADFRLLKLYLLTFGFETGGYLKPFAIRKSWRDDETEMTE